MAFQQDFILPISETRNYHPEAGQSSSGYNPLMNGFRRGSGGSQNFSNSSRLESGTLSDFNSFMSPQSHSIASAPSAPPALSRRSGMTHANSTSQSTTEPMFWNSPPMPQNANDHSHQHSQSLSSNNSSRDSMPPPPLPAHHALRRGISFSNDGMMQIDHPVHYPGPILSASQPAAQRQLRISQAQQSSMPISQPLSPVTPSTAKMSTGQQTPGQQKMRMSPAAPSSPLLPLPSASSPNIPVSPYLSDRRPDLASLSPQQRYAYPGSPSGPKSPTFAQSSSQSAYGRLQGSPMPNQDAQMWTYSPTFSASNPHLQPTQSTFGNSPGPSSRALQQFALQNPQDLSRNASSQYYTPRMPNSPSAASSSASASPGSTYQQAAQIRQPPAQFRKFKHRSELHCAQNMAPTGRRANPAGGFISPLRALTSHLLQTYNLVNPAFRYEASHNPRRVLTKPSVKAGNDGYDNEEADYILYVNDWLGAEDGNKYLILDILGQGTFGQVVKCQNMKTHEIVAVKVVKNKPAYFNQSMMEVTILDLLNNTWDVKDEHHILRLKDQFIHCRHLCLVFELLSSNLYDLIKQNSFRGLSTSLVRVFTAQLLDCLTVLNEARLIHCDLKPENILLKTLQSPTIKVIDFGSACHERQTVYTYIQSRFYRSPEVLLGLPYSSTIDMWSLGCICVELFLGLPLFPGTSEYNQIARIVEMLGPPPSYMLEVGKQASNFFEPTIDNYGSKSWRLKSIDQYSREYSSNEQPSKRYFDATTLPEIIYTYPMVRKDAKPADVQREMNNRKSFIDFVQGLLNLDPMQRWSPQQARMHPFILGEPLTQPFVPAMGAKVVTKSQPNRRVSQSVSEPRQKYGGMPPAQPQSSPRTYQDAAAYNRHLAQQQAYTAYNQAEAARAAQVSKNPYVDGGSMQSMPYTSATGMRAALSTSGRGQVPQSGPSNLPPVHTHPGRGRSMTLVDAIPPQMQRIGLDLAAAGKSMTPVLRREDQALAWEQRQKGDIGRKVSMNRHHPALDLLTQQAEMNYRTGQYYQPQIPYQAPFQVVVDDSQRLHDVDVPLSAPPPAHHATQAPHHRYGQSMGQYDAFDQFGLSSLDPQANAQAKIVDPRNQQLPYWSQNT